MYYRSRVRSHLNERLAASAEYRRQTNQQHAGRHPGADTSDVFGINSTRDLVGLYTADGTTHALLVKRK